MEGTNAKECNSSKVRNKMNTNMKKSKKVCFEINFRFHMVQIEEMVNGNHLYAYQVTIGKIAEMGTGTSKKRAKETAARKLIPKI